MSFHLYFDKQVHKKLKKKLNKKKTRTEKQTRAAALGHTIYFFSLIKGMIRCITAVH